MRTYQDFIGGPSDGEVVGAGGHNEIGETVYGPYPLGWDDETRHLRRHELAGYVLTEIQGDRAKYHYRPWGDEPTMRLAWLYGLEPDDEGNYGSAVWELEPHLDVSAFGGAVHDADGREFSPEGAVEYARALLAASERARLRSE